MDEISLSSLQLLASFFSQFLTDSGSTLQIVSKRDMKRVTMSFTKPNFLLSTVSINTGPNETPQTPMSIDNGIF